MFELKDIIIFSVGAVFLLLWLFLYKKGYKHHEMFIGLDENEFPLNEVYHVGYEMLNIIGYKYKSSKDNEDRKKIAIYYGDKYSEYYLRVIHSQAMTMLLTLLVFAFIFYGLVGEMVMLAMIVVVAFTVYYYYITLIQAKIEKRSVEMMRDFPEMVSKLALLTNAGMILKESWNEVANSSDGVIYQEMRTTVDDMNNGVAEIEAYINFGARSFLPEVKKFASTISQGVLKGNAELSLMLQQQSNEVWELKKQNVKREGEKAASKLTLPLMVMFVGLLLMIIIPIFSGFGV